MPGHLPAAAAARFRWRDLVDAPRCVWLLTVALLLLLLSATVLYPPYRGPDEPQHVDLAVALDHGTSPLWSPASRMLSEGALEGGLLPNTRLGVPQRLADRDLPAHADRPSYDDLGGDVATDLPNQLVQHPPLYYLALAAVLAVVPDWEDQPFDRVLGLLRLLSVLCIAPLPLLAHAAARRLTSAPVVPVLAAVAVVGVPQVVHIGASLNNDDPLNLLAGLSTVLAVHVATGDVSRRTAVAAGVVLGLGLFTKGLMLVFVGVLALAYLLAWARSRGRPPVGSALLSLGVALVLGGWWWVRNLVLYGRVQPAGTDRSVEVVRGWGDAAWRWLGDFAHFVTIRYWFDHPSGSSTGVSIGLTFLATAVVVVALVVAIGSRPRPPAPTVERLPLALAVLTFPLLLAVLLQGSWESFTFGYDQPALQGRYMFGALVGVSCAVAVGWARWFSGARPVAVVVPLLAWSVGAQALAAYSATRLYWWPADGGVPALLSGFERVPPWPGPTVPVVMSLTVLVAVAAAVSTVLHVRRLGAAA